MDNNNDNFSELPEFTILIPCYNEEHAIDSTIKEILDSLRGIQGYKIIIVNDGSTDNTEKLLLEIERKYELVVVLQHDRNKGYGAAIKSGILRSKTELLVITDADGTYPNHRIPQLVAIAKDADMVVGARTGSNVHSPFMRRLPKLFFRWYSSWLTGQSIPDINSGLRVFRRSVVEKFIHILPDGFSLTTTITLAMLTNYKDVRFIPVDYKKRIGKSKIRPIPDTLLFLQLIVRTAMYFAPLRVLTPFILLLSGAFGVSIVYDLFVLGDVTDKTLILLMFVCNTILFALLADMIDKRSN